MACHARTRKAFTLKELLVVAALLVLLLGVTGPGLQALRRQVRQNTCLMNLAVIGAATQAYAAEDPHELIVPIHQYMVKSTANTAPGSDYWMWRTANWFAWGGKSCTERFLTNCYDPNNPLCGPTVGHPLGRARGYAAETRPLNGYVPSLDVYHCPQDVGYPDYDWINDSPHYNANRVCFDTLGNSYKANMYCFMNGSGAFAVGPWGHILSTLYEPDRLVLLGDPLFHEMIRRPKTEQLTGWHGLGMDNRLFCDGSARYLDLLAQDSDQYWLTPEFQQEVGPNYYLITRGSGWTFDCYPTPGARIWGSGSTWNPPYNGLGIPNYWPFLNAQNNLD